MPDSISMSFDTKQADKMLSDLLNKVQRPAKLMERVQGYVDAVTLKMFTGRRPDTSGVRGQKWPKLKLSTIKQKRALVKRGLAEVADRPMVRTGRTRDSLKVLEKSQKGFVYGTRQKSEKGFSYPGYHNKNKFPFLFFREKDYAQMTKMVVDYLEGALKSASNYVRGGL